MRFHGLDLNLLVALDALLTHQNVTRAAEQLNLSQSALSGALARLRETRGANNGAGSRSYMRARCRSGSLFVKYIRQCGWRANILRFPVSPTDVSEECRLIAPSSSRRMFGVCQPLLRPSAPSY